MFFKRRIAALTIDFLIVLFICSLFFSILSKVVDLDIIKKDVQNTISSIMFLIFFSFKDIVLKGSSIGKRILKIRIVYEDTYEIPTRKILLQRGIIAVVFYPINFMYMLFTKKTLADKIFNTMVDRR